MRVLRETRGLSQADRDTAESAIEIAFNKLKNRWWLILFENGKCGSILANHSAVRMPMAQRLNFQVRLLSTNNITFRKSNNLFCFSKGNSLSSKTAVRTQIRGPTSGIR